MRHCFNELSMLTGTVNQHSRPNTLACEIDRGTAFTEETEAWCELG